MDLVIYILVGIFIVVMTIRSVREDWSNRKKDLEQRREETYEHYVERIEEFKATGAKENDSSDEG